MIPLCTTRWLCIALMSCMGAIAYNNDTDLNSSMFSQVCGQRLKGLEAVSKGCSTVCLAKLFDYNLLGIVQKKELEQYFQVLTNELEYQNKLLQGLMQIFTKKNQQSDNAIQSLFEQEPYDNLSVRACLTDQEEDQRNVETTNQYCILLKMERDGVQEILSKHRCLDE
jgi:hypothetical protein